MKKNELENLSTLLLNQEDKNIAIGFSILEQNKEAVLDLHRELVILWQLHKDASISQQAQQLLKQTFSKKKCYQWKRGFELFQHLSFYPNKSSKKMVEDHQSMRSIFLPYLKKNIHYLSCYNFVCRALLRYPEKKYQDLSIQYLQDILATYPYHKESLLILADNVYRKEEADQHKILPCYQKILDKNPSDASVLIKAAQFAQKIGRYPLAFEYTEQAIAIDPHNIYYKQRNISLCTFHWREKEAIQRADKYIQDLIKRSSRSYSTWITVGNFRWLAQKDYQAAEEAYQKGLSIRENQADLLGNLAELYIDVHEKYEEGWKLYQKALEGGCTPYQLINIFSFLVLKKEDFQEAQKVYDKIPIYNDNKISRASYLTDTQWNNFLEAEKKLKAHAQ